MNEARNIAQSLNIRHLVALNQVVLCGNIKQAAAKVHLSQPAISQALQRVESLLQVNLFERSNIGSYPTPEGVIFSKRINRALDHLVSFNRYSMRGGSERDMSRLLTDGQLRSLIAVVEHGSYTLAANQLGLAQPTVHRAVSDLQKLLNRQLFMRRAKGVDATSEAKILARQASLAYAEIQQGLDELEEQQGRLGGRLSIGCLPMARTDLLPDSVTKFLDAYPDVQVSIMDGPYDEQLHALLHGQIDLIVGALRDPKPTEEVVQRTLFDDELALVVRTGHPALALPHGKESIFTLRQYDWIAPRRGTPTRRIFKKIFQQLDLEEPNHLLECSSMIAIRGLLIRSNRVALLSRRQVLPEIESGQLAAISIDFPFCTRPIGITHRESWQPTKLQRAYIELLKSNVKIFEMQLT